MTRQEFDTEMAKLNKSQQRALRSLFTGRVPSRFIVSVEYRVAEIFTFFGRSQHRVALGPRGAVLSHEINAQQE